VGCAFRRRVLSGSAYLTREKTADNGLPARLSTYRPVAPYHQPVDDEEAGLAHGYTRRTVTEDYHDFPIDYRVEVSEPQAPADVPGGTATIQPGSYRARVRRHWPTQGIDEQGNIRVADVWLGLEGLDGTEVVWVREADTTPIDNAPSGAS
jgi:hypothetical protein